LKGQHLHLLPQWLGEAQIESSIGGEEDGHPLGWRRSSARSGAGNLPVGRQMIQRGYRLLRQLGIAAGTDPDSHSPHQTHASVKAGRHLAAFMELVALLDFLIPQADHV